MKGTRFLKEMASVVLNPEYALQNGKKGVYYVYRQIKTDGDLRYDVTALLPGLIGKEYNRTKGNQNDLGYQELYTVLKGKGVFLFQKMSGNVLEDAYFLPVTPGNWVIVPPYYWVIAINTDLKQDLEMGNWVSVKTTNQYEELEKMHGMAYYLTTEGWIKNKNYKYKKELHEEVPLDKKPESLDFLRTGIAEVVKPADT